MTESQKKEDIVFFHNIYRTRKFGNKVLVVTDHGQWIILSDKDFRNMRLNKSTPDVTELLLKKGVLVNEDNIDNIISYYGSKSKFVYSGTSLHIIVMTKTCNNTCSYCHASAVANKKLNMNKETAEKVVDFIFQTPSKHISIEFQGGEPLVNFDVMKFIVEYSLDKNKKCRKELDISLVSNMNLLNEDMIKYFKEKDVRVCTSLDGPKNVHDCQRKCLMGPSSYDKTTAGIKKLRAAGFSPAALPTITKTALENAKEIIDEYIDNKIPVIHLRNVHKLGYAENDNIWGKVGYTAEEFIEFWKKSMGYILELNKKNAGVIRERAVMLFLRKIFTNTDPNYLDIRSPCGAGIGQMSYDINGDIYSCDEGRMMPHDLFRLGNVKEHTYKEIIESSSVISLISASICDTKICDTCAYKPYCGICPVLLHSKSGSLIGHITSSDFCKIQMAQLDYIFDKLINDESARETFTKWMDIEFKGTNLNTRKEIIKK